MYSETPLMQVSNTPDGPVGWISSAARDYMIKHGEEGKNEILKKLNSLIYYTEDYWQRMRRNND